MSEIRMFRMENRTKFCSDFRHSDFRHSGCSVRSIVWLYYKPPKSERSVGRVKTTEHLKSEQNDWISDNVLNLNCLGMGQLWKGPKSERPDFRQLLYLLGLGCFVSILQQNYLFFE